MTKKALVVAAGIAALAACDTTVTKSELASVNYGPRPQHWQAAIRDYASQGFDLVIAHGSQYGAGVEEIAKDFPAVSFAWGTDVNTFGLPNV